MPSYITRSAYPELSQCMMGSKKICIVLTSTALTEKSNKPTGFDVRDVAHVCEMLCCIHHYPEESNALPSCRPWFVHVTSEVQVINAVVL